MRREILSEPRGQKSRMRSSTIRNVNDTFSRWVGRKCKSNGNDFHYEVKHDFLLRAVFMYLEGVHYSCLGLTMKDGTASMEK